jgi:hypothetical protein
MNHDELKNNWSRAQEMFGDFCRPHRLAQEARYGFSKEGRGAVFLYRAQETPVCNYAPRSWVDENLDEGSFRERILSMIDDYQTETQAIVLVTFDDVFLSETLLYHAFKLIFPADPVLVQSQC